jgi:hypothetical protein
MKQLEDSADETIMNSLGNAFRWGTGLPVDKEEAVRWYGRAAALSSGQAFVNLGLCFEQGEGAPKDLALAMKCYLFAARRGHSGALLSLGLFQWYGLGGIPPDRTDARKYWAAAGFHFPEAFDSSEIDIPHLEGRSDRFGSGRVDTGFEMARSFEFYDPDRLRSIESVVLIDGHSSVRELLLHLPHPSASELAVRIGEGISREGNRCLVSSLDSGKGEIMRKELNLCSDLRSLLPLCVNFYTRASFLYRRVNLFMRETGNRDEETGRNLGLYIGILRECFCLRSALNPLEWSRPLIVYRGAHFPLEVLVDYARRKGQHIWWQGFTSVSADINRARGFPGNVLFKIFVTSPAPSLAQYSAYPVEQEFVLNPYQHFVLDYLNWDDSLHRWVIEVNGLSSPDPMSWFVESGTTTPLPPPWPMHLDPM